MMMCQTYPHTQNCPTSFLRDWYYICTRRRLAPLRQRTGETPGYPAREREKRGRVGRERTMAAALPFSQPLLIHDIRYKRSSSITLTAKVHLLPSQTYPVAKSRHTSSRPTAQIPLHPNGNWVRAWSTIPHMARFSIVLSALCSLPSLTISGRQSCFITASPTSTKTIEDTSSRWTPINCWAMLYQPLLSKEEPAILYVWALMISPIIPVALLPIPSSTIPSSTLF